MGASPVWNGLRFETRASVAPGSSNRADVACFVGLVAFRPGPLPDHVLAQWKNGPLRELVREGERPLIPVLVDGVELFDTIFDGWVRDGGTSWEGPLAGAVRDFFRQGGKRCWVVPVGAPAPPPTSEPAALTALSMLVPSIADGTIRSEDRRTWRSLAHLFGLPDVALVCLPDLPTLAGAEQPPAEPASPAPAPSVAFVECSTADVSVPPPTLRRAPGAPRLAERAWGVWRAGAHRAVSWVARHRPDVVLVLAVPLPAAGSIAEADVLPLLQPMLGSPDAGGLGTGYVQFAYPWIATDTSVDRPGGLASPDGVFTGIVARAALARGTFRSLVQERVEGVRSLEPALPPASIVRTRPAIGSTVELALRDRVSLFSRTPRGVRVVSDVTPSLDPVWRQAGNDRLVGALRRSLQHLGDGVVFEPSSPPTWRRLRDRVASFLESVRLEGGLSTDASSYRVRCDQRTMTQQDIDAGRVIVEIEITPATSIERITIVLAATGAGVSVADGRGGA